jgi:hypothetical protein
MNIVGAPFVSGEPYRKEIGFSPRSAFINEAKNFFQSQ